MPTSTPQVVAYDSYTAQSAPSVNRGSYKQLDINSGAASRNGYVFWTPQAPPLSSVLAAPFKVYEKSRATGGSRTLTVELLAARFDESKVNYANAPGVVPGGPSVSVTQSNASTDNRLWEFDLAPLMSAVASGTPWFGIRITSNNTTTISLHSSEASTTSRKPTAAATWADAPVAPTGLSPAGGRAVSVVRPLHRFQFGGGTGDAITAYQLQWATSGATFTAASGFSATDLNTGTVTSTVPQWVPTADTSVGAGRTWTVRTRDVAGVWTEYAAPVSWVRTAKGTVTITSPAASPSNIVTEPTPPLSHTVSGTTQTAWQKLIVDDADRSLILHDSTKRSGTELTYTPASDVIVSTTRAYGLVVRVWDAVARESTPGDPAYIEEYRAFTLSAAGSGPVTTLTATTDDTPAVDFAWTRSSTPDFWALRVGGIFTGAQIPGASLLVSGTSYAYEWWGAKPRTDLAVEMVPVTNGVAAGGGNVVNVRTEPTGVWLSGTDGEDAVCLATDGGIGSWSDNSISGVHYAVGESFPAVRTQRLGTRQTAQSGVIESGTGHAAAVARAERLRKAGTDLRLVLTDTNIVGRVDKMRPVDPEGEFGAGSLVEFDFYQQTAS